MLVNPDADWVAELAELPSNAGDADTLEPTPEKIGNVIQLSRESIEDSAVAELDAVGRAMVRGVAIKVDARFFSPAAATATAPAGIFATTLPSGGATVDIDGLIGAVGVRAAGGLADAIFISPSGLTTIRQGHQRRLLHLGPDLAGRRADRGRDAVADPGPERGRGAGGRYLLHRPGGAPRRQRGLLRGRAVHPRRRGRQGHDAGGLGRGGDPDAFAVIGTPVDAGGQGQEVSGQVVIAAMWDRIEVVGAVDPAAPPSQAQLDAIADGLVAANCGVRPVVRVLGAADDPAYRVEDPGPTCEELQGRWRPWSPDRR